MRIDHGRRQRKLVVELGSIPLREEGEWDLSMDQEGRESTISPVLADTGEAARAA